MEATMEIATLKIITRKNEEVILVFKHWQKNQKKITCISYRLMCTLTFRKAVSNIHKKKTHKSMFSNLKEKHNSKRTGLSKKMNSDNSIINNPLKKKKEGDF